MIARMQVSTSVSRSRSSVIRSFIVGWAYDVDRVKVPPGGMVLGTTNGVARATLAGSRSGGATRW